MDQKIITRKGKLHQKNYDFANIINRRDGTTIFYIADVMGISDKQLQCKYIIEKELSRFIETIEKDDIVNEELSNLAKRIHRKIRLINTKNTLPIGATLTLVLLLGKETYLMHAGDTVLYGVNDEFVTQLTEKHNFSQKKKNILNQCFGISNELKPQVQKISNFIRLVFCTDGVFENMTQVQFNSIIKEKLIPNIAMKMDKILTKQDDDATIMIIDL